MSKGELKKTSELAMKDKIGDILVFLKENKEYNHKLQEKYYLSVLCPYDTLEDKIMSLLYDIANTQSQPKINKLSKFYKEINKNKETFASFNNFVKQLIIIQTEKEKPKKHLPKKFKNNQNYQTLFEAMRVQDGWGDKTAALFVKNIYNYHSGKYDEKLKIWDENKIPNLDENDKLFLPVDAVIITIFNRLDEITNKSGKKKNWTFHKINKFLQKNNYSNEEMLLLDDLWFWGFITQETDNNERKIKYNGAKYWMIKDAPKNKEKKEAIEQKAKEFIKLLKGDNKWKIETPQDL